MEDAPVVRVLPIEVLAVPFFTEMVEFGYPDKPRLIVLCPAWYVARASVGISVKYDA